MKRARAEIWLEILLVPMIKSSEGGLRRINDDVIPIDISRISLGTKLQGELQYSGVRVGYCVLKYKSDFGDACVTTLKPHT